MDIFGIGETIGGLLGFEGQRRTNSAQHDVSQEQMAFQERMSNTAYQRSTQDMMAAGLNPMLGYSQGGASAPTGSMPVYKNPVDAGAATATAAAALRLVNSQTQNVEAQTAKTVAETPGAQSSSVQAGQLVEKLGYELDSLRERYGQLMGGSKERAYKRLENVRMHSDIEAESARGDIAPRQAEAVKLDNRIRKIEALLKELEEPGARNEAALQRQLGVTGKYVGKGLDWAGSLLHSGANAARMFRTVVGK